MKTENSTKRVLSAGDENQQSRLAPVISSYYKLTNRDISEKFKHFEFYLSQPDFVSAFAYWIIKHSDRTHLEFYDISKPLTAFHNYVHDYFEDFEIDSVQKFSYQELENILDENKLAEIPEIFALNQTQPDFIDLGALARNVFYMICRQEITQPL